ncbi:MAG TPA: signal peptidase II [Gammaproteobacteria bacterium]|nr:signal peptidase II [Gammaproteobacteria bacterium]
MNNRLSHLWLICVALGIDQLTKHGLTSALSMHTPVPLTSWLQLYLTHNSGAAFSLLSQQGSWKFLVFFITAFGMLIFLGYEYTKPKSFLKTTAIILLSGGVIGNLIDRISLGYVIDFIDIHYHNIHFPIFNFADIWISLGCLLWVMDMYSTTAQSPSSKTISKPL